MKDFVCNYAVIRFLPYRETGEFVNIGVVLYCPQAGYYGFRFDERDEGRVKGFFPELDDKVYKAGLLSMRTRLELLEERFSKGHPVSEMDLPHTLGQFRELVRAREGLFHFGGHGVLVAGDPKDALEQLFGQFVQRRSAQHPEYQETAIPST